MCYYLYMSNNMNYKRVTKKQSKIARCRAHKILSDLHVQLKNEYRFATKLVGSATWGTIIEDKNGENQKKLRAPN